MYRDELVTKILDSNHPDMVELMMIVESAETVAELEEVELILQESVSFEEVKAKIREKASGAAAAAKQLADKTKERTKDLKAKFAQMTAKFKSAQEKVTKKEPKGFEKDLDDAMKIMLAISIYDETNPKLEEYQKQIEDLMEEIGRLNVDYMNGRISSDQLAKKTKSVMDKCVKIADKIIKMAEKDEELAEELKEAAENMEKFKDQVRAVSTPAGQYGYM